MKMRQFLLKLCTGILLITGVGQLAISQIHILATTKIFANQIGLYLFLFIIFGLTTGFNAVLIEKPLSLISFAFSSIMACIGGGVYLQLLAADVIAQDSLRMEDVLDSWQIVIASMIIYGVGLILVPILSWPDVNPFQNNE